MRSEVITSTDCLSLLRFSKKLRSDKQSVEVITSLRKIYFEPKTIALLEAASNCDQAEFPEILRKVKLKLLDCRYEVEESLGILEREGLNEELSLRSKRIYLYIRSSKVNLRRKLFEIALHCENSSAKQKLSKLLTEIIPLNDRIEEIEEKILEDMKRE